MRELPIPPHFDPDACRRGLARALPGAGGAGGGWAREHGIRPAAEDRLRICLVAVDVQNTFCVPGFELFVGGRSGTGAVDDNRRLCAFLYRNLASITRVIPTMDTHHAMQIFHPVYLVNERGEHPEPFTLVSVEDVERGVWRFNEAVAAQPRPDRRRRPAAAAPLCPPAGRRRQVRADRLALPRHARRHRPRPGVGGGGGDVLPRHRPRQPARLPGQGQQPADRALLDHRPRGDQGRPRRDASPSATRCWSTICTSTMP